MDKNEVTIEPAAEIPQPTPPDQKLKPKIHKYRHPRGDGSIKNILITDISVGTFRYAYISFKKHKACLKSFQELSKDDLHIYSGDVLDLHSAGMSWLKRNCNFKIDHLIIVSWHLDFFIRRLELPKLKKSELEQAVIWEVDKQIPISVEDAYVRIKMDDSRADLSDVTVGAVPRKQIDQWKYVGETLSGVVPVPVALASIGPAAKSKDLAYCYVYHDDSFIIIGFYNSEGLQYSSPVVDIRSDLEITLGEGKMDIGRIVNELTNSVEVFYSNFPDMKVDGIVLLTSPDERTELASLIGETIVIDVISADPYANAIEADQDLWQEAGIKYLPLIGAVRISDDDFVFSPQSIRVNLRTKKVKKYIRYSLIFGIICLFLLSAHWIFAWRIEKSRLDSLLTRKARIENSAAYREIFDYDSKIKFMNALKIQFESYDDEYSSFTRMIGNIVPQGIFLESVSLSRAGMQMKITITGYFEGDRSEADVAILNFMENLKANGIAQIKLNRLGRKISGKMKSEIFTIDGTWTRNE